MTSEEWLERFGFKELVSASLELQWVLDDVVEIKESGVIGDSEVQVLLDRGKRRIGKFWLRLIVSYGWSSDMHFWVVENFPFFHLSSEYETTMIDLGAIGCYALTDPSSASSMPPLPSPAAAFDFLFLLAKYWHKMLRRRVSKIPDLKRFYRQLGQNVCLASERTITSTEGVDDPLYCDVPKPCRKSSSSSLPSPTVPSPWLVKALRGYSSPNMQFSWYSLSIEFCSEVHVGHAGHEIEHAAGPKAVSVVPDMFGEREEFKM
ncbi:hypothetical protein FNV43_RR02528 [Rhamnella rubrinervis]|uniref:Uncharacterized protein n=1 Tax=Rhamnella rubrinervis TaxID=2594499 RepID=A0A8K0MTU1_9ROSA|nr:hypothetical protein FNV43_RR02528 [Rhamnella rubrinervis]